MVRKVMVRVRELWLFVIMLVTAQCICVADVAVDDGEAPIKPNPRYLALLMGSTPFTFNKSVDNIEKMLEAGPNATFSKMTHDEIAAFSKCLCVVLDSKTVVEAACAVKDIEAVADKLHGGSRLSFAARLAVLIAASKDAKSQAVATALLKRVAKIKTSALADIAAHADKIDRSAELVDAYCMGLGLSEAPEDVYDFLFGCSFLGWRNDSGDSKQRGAVEQKTIKSAECGIDVMLAVDGVVTAKTLGKAKAAVQALDKAVKAKIALQVSPTGSSKPFPEESAEARAGCYEAYVKLIEYVQKKSDLPAIDTVLKAKGTEVKRMSEGVRKKVSR